ncbi:unnamed protein product [Mytilus coruscus]|uniref:Transglutaminase-like domain-containing protein n=1 Tax=Mytilus coruscus TaxID=42192 RepID=A0A6J8BI46_MYTCO|nr:unnamed protein product [Mytilus coruscus]
MGCSSSSTSGTGHSIEEVKTQERVSNQKNGVNYNSTEAVNRPQTVQSSPVKTTNNDQTTSHKTTTYNDKEKSSANSDDLKLDYDEFRDIDEHARQAPRSVEESIETLAQYLAKPAKNDIEVVRGLYVWICENISYDTNAYFGGNLSSLATKGGDVLKSKSSVCAGYANVFESLCQLNRQKIFHSSIVRHMKLQQNNSQLWSGNSSRHNLQKYPAGTRKDISHKPGGTITYNQKTNHAWNIVQLNGVWRFIETTWGAGHVDKRQEIYQEFQ